LSVFSSRLFINEKHSGGLSGTPQSSKENRLDRPQSYLAIYTVSFEAGLYFFVLNRYNRLSAHVQGIRQILPAPVCRFAQLLYKSSFFLECHNKKPRVTFLLPGALVF
jgi:hypothetical protein